MIKKLAKCFETMMPVASSTVKTVYPDQRASGLALYNTTQTVAEVPETSRDKIENSNVIFENYRMFEHNAISFLIWRAI